MKQIALYTILSLTLSSFSICEARMTPAEKHAQVFDRMGKGLETALSPLNQSEVRRERIFPSERHRMVYYMLSDKERKTFDKMSEKSQKLLIDTYFNDHATPLNRKSGQRKWSPVERHMRVFDRMNEELKYNLSPLSRLDSYFKNRFPAKRFKMYQESSKLAKECSLSNSYERGYEIVLVNNTESPSTEKDDALYDNILKDDASGTSENASPSPQDQEGGQNKEPTEENADSPASKAMKKQNKKNNEQDDKDLQLFNQ